MVVANHKILPMTTNVLEKIIDSNKKSKLSLADSVISNRKKKKVHGGGNREVVSDIIMCLDLYYRKREHSELELFKIITDGRKDLSFVDAVVLSHDAVDIFDIKENGEKTQLDRIKLGIERYFKQKPDNWAGVNPILADQLKRMHKNKVKEINLIFVRNFLSEESKRKFILEYEHLSRKGYCNVHVFTRSDLISRHHENEDLESISFNKISKPVIEKKGNKIKCILTLVSLKDILDEYAKLPDKELLFFKNIRKPLEEKKLQDSLFRSLEKDPQTFHYRHNGIVMTGRSVAETRGNCLEVFAPQVVNGAQTLGALLTLYRKSKRHFRGAKLVAKIIAVEDPWVIDDICEAANTQKKVTAADIRTNESLQKDLELYISSLAGRVYVYVRGKISPAKRKALKKNYRIITKETFIQWANSALLGRPHESKSSKTKLFEKGDLDGTDLSRYKQIKDAIYGNWDHIGDLCRIGTAVEDRIRALKKPKRNMAEIMDKHILTTMYKDWTRAKKTQQDEKKLDMSFKDAYKLHYNRYKLAAKGKGRNYSPRKYFIREESSI